LRRSAGAPRRAAVASGSAVTQHSTWRTHVADKFGWVLIACLVTYTMLVTVDSRWSALTGSVTVLATVLLTIYASIPPRGLRYAAIGSIILALVIGVLNAILHKHALSGFTFLLAGISLGCCIIAILLRVASETHVSVGTVLAVLDVYVMLGLFFTFVDAGVGHITGHFFAQASAYDLVDYPYLSYVTLTTVGFGDLTPGTGVARALIIIEALIGQIFLVTMVARMVSLMGTERAPVAMVRDREPPEPQE